MKNLLSALVMVSMIALAACSTNAQAEEIDWTTDYSQALEEAKNRDTIIMVKVYTDWCHWCKELDKNVFTDDRVIETSQKIVNLKANAEDEADGTLVAQTFGVSGYPTTLFINGEGQEVDRIGGYLPADEFLAEMERIISGENTLLSRAADYESGALSADGHIEYALSFLQQEDMEKGVEILKANLNRYPGHESNAQAYGFLAVAAALDGNEAQAQEYLQSLRDAFPGETEFIGRVESTLEQIKNQ